MNGINDVTLLGNLTDEPQIRATSNGKKVASFSIATNESHKDQSGNWVSEAEYHRVIAWEGLANTVEKCLHKGSPVFVKGKIKTRQYQGKDGQNRYVTEILINQIVLIGDKPKPQSQASNGNAYPQKGNVKPSYNHRANNAQSDFSGIQARYDENGRPLNQNNQEEPIDDEVPF